MVLRLEYGAARNDDGRSRVLAQRDIRGRDAAVYLDVVVKTALHAQLLAHAHFFQAILLERLSAEARLHGHDEQKVDLVKIRLDDGEGLIRIDDKPAFHAF